MASLPELVTKSCEARKLKGTESCDTLSTTICTLPLYRNPHVQRHATNKTKTAVCYRNACTNETFFPDLALSTETSLIRPASILRKFLTNRTRHTITLTGCPLAGGLYLAGQCHPIVIGRCFHSQRLHPCPCVRQLRLLPATAESTSIQP